jgi:2-hydroxychromene-2-carboxylate isomerase
MRNRTRLIAAAAAVSAAVAAGSAAAVASTTGAKPSAPAKTMSASEKPGGSKTVGSKSAEEQGHDAFAAALAQELHVTTAQADAALRPIFAAGQADPSSPVFSAAARSLGVSTQRLAAALAQAKQSLGASTQAEQSPAGSKAVGSKAVGSRSAEEQGHDAFAAAVAQELHVTTAQVNAALQPLFAAGQADTSSPVFAAAARQLGVSTQQLSTALAHAKQSLAGGN